MERSRENMPNPNNKKTPEISGGFVSKHPELKAGLVAMMLAGMISAEGKVSAEESPADLPGQQAENYKPHDAVSFNDDEGIVVLTTRDQEGRVADVRVKKEKGDDDDIELPTSAAREEVPLNPANDYKERGNVEEKIPEALPGNAIPIPELPATPEKVKKGMIPILQPSSRAAKEFLGLIKDKPLDEKNRLIEIWNKTVRSAYEKLMHNKFRNDRRHLDKFLNSLDKDENKVQVLGWVRKHGGNWFDNNFPAKEFSPTATVEALNKGLGKAMSEGKMTADEASVRRMVTEHAVRNRQTFEAEIEKMKAGGKINDSVYKALIELTESYPDSSLTLQNMVKQKLLGGEIDQDTANKMMQMGEKMLEMRQKDIFEVARLFKAKFEQKIISQYPQISLAEKETKFYDMVLREVNKRYEYVLSEKAKFLNKYIDFIAALIKVESDWDNKTVSTAGYHSYMQIKGSVSREQSLQRPEEGIEAGMKEILSYLIRTRNVPATLFYYNAGPGAFQLKFAAPYLKNHPGKVIYADRPGSRSKKVVTSLPEITEMGQEEGFLPTINYIAKIETLWSLIEGGHDKLKAEELKEKIQSKLPNFKLNFNLPAGGFNR